MFDPPTPTRDEESFKQYVGDKLREQDARMANLESQNVEMKDQNAEMLDIMRMGKTFFKFCKWFGIGLKWVAGVAMSFTLLYKLAASLLVSNGGPPPGSH